MIRENSREAGGHQVAATAGLILVDGSGRPLYFNSEAVTILTYPGLGRNLEKVTDLLPRGIRSVLPRSCTAGNGVRETEFSSGRRRYLCRVVTLNPSSGMRPDMITALLLERYGVQAANVSDVAERFRLTLREREVVGLLALGLTSKEIAGRMEISPNTVKTFFRLVMTKMGVSTRAGIVGKIARI